MSDTIIEKKRNLLLEAARKKAENSHGSNTNGILGKDLSRQFSKSQNKFFRPTKPGGRNGQGKPC
jgi:hypothetical protein